MVNEKLFKTTDRWIAIAKQHNFPPPTKEEQEDYDLRQQERENLSAAEKKKRKPEVSPAGEGKVDEEGRQGFQVLQCSASEAREPKVAHGKCG